MFSSLFGKSGPLYTPTPPCGEGGGLPSESLVLPQYGLESSSWDPSTGGLCAIGTPYLALGVVVGSLCRGLGTDTAGGLESL